MTLLHDHFTSRNQQAFQRLLDGSNRGQSSSAGAGGLSTSGGKSWNRPSPLTMAMTCDVNARDWLGRTVLHLACASIEPSSLEYVRMLLAHSAVNVNLQDTESHWTAVHRALYQGNIAAARLLLQRTDTDTSVKDLEGYTAFDLYNSTLRTTKPSINDEGQAELFTWGTNRNAALGLGDGDDRTYPDQVVIPRKEDTVTSEKSTLEQRFSHIHVKQIAMSRLHTVVVTSESRGNLRVCGFGSGGRLGPGQHTQYSLVPLQQFTHTVKSVALGQDHTMALTDDGEVLTWGLNRFSQLGYVVESTPSGIGLSRLEEPIQASPRKVQGALKKENVRGVAACKTASACWTDTEVFTWGTNNGQLGYDKSAQPVQVFPRKVTKVTQPVLSISITDSAMACLLNTQDTICLWNDRHFKINFPAHAFPQEIHVYRPPMAVKDAKIAKITSCDDSFAALSSNGEVFVFTAPKPSEAEAASGKDRASIVPQRVWTLRKQFTAVRDVALGADGSIILCTESGHVFLHSRSAKSGQSGFAKTFKFQRLPYIQRVVEVCANSTGAFGAIRVDHKPSAIRLSGRTLGQDLAAIQPYLCFSSLTGSNSPRPSTIARGDSPTFDPDDDGEDVHVQNDIHDLMRLFDLLKQDKISRKGPNGHGIFENVPLAHGADLMVQVRSGFEVPAHRLLLAARCPVLCQVLSSTKGLQDQDSKIALRFSQTKPALKTSALPRLTFVGCNAISVLILLVYLYSDELLAIWDPRVAAAVERQLQEFNVKPAQVKSGLQVLARLLDLRLLGQATESPAKRIPPSSLVRDMGQLFYDAQTQTHGRTVLEKGPLSPDIVLRLADKEVVCHSVLLRARSSFFAGFFDDRDWTAKRWSVDGTLTIDLKHMDWRVLQFVLRYVCCGDQANLFETLDFVNSVDEVLGFMFNVMAAANELLLDRLILLCSTVILQHLSVNNSCYILTDATHFNSNALVESIQEYMAANMELLLENRMLDDLTPSLIKQLSVFVRRQQTEKYPISRSNRLVDQAMTKHSEWLTMQDIPQPIVRTNKSFSKDLPKLSPPGPSKRSRRTSLTPMSSPSIRPLPTTRTGPSGDDLFEMDDAELLPLNLEPARELASTPTAVWKGKSVAPRVDMKAIMAEAETGKSAPTRSTGPSYRSPEANGSTPGIHVLSQKSSSREWRKLDWPSSGDERPGSASRSSSSPWKVSATQPTAGPINPYATSTPINTAPISVTRPKDAGPASALNESGVSSSTTKPSPSTPPRSHLLQPGLGPVFTPSRQPASKASTPVPRRVSGSPWTFPPVQPVVQSSPTGPSMSFTAIQQLQLDQGAGHPKDKRSLREIQEEEQAHQAEADFLKWWAAEEERVKMEAHGLPQPPGTAKKSPKKNRPSKGKSSIPASASTPGQASDTTRRQRDRKPR